MIAPTLEYYRIICDKIKKLHIIILISVGRMFLSLLRIPIDFDNLVGWLCFTSHRQRGHLETAPPFTVERVNTFYINRIYANNINLKAFLWHVKRHEFCFVDIKGEFV